MGLTATEKQNWERYFVHANFSDVMEADETIVIAGSTISALDAGVWDEAAGAYSTNPADATSLVTDQTSIYAEGHKYYIRIMDGVEDKGPYKLTFRITTSSGNRWEVDGELKLKET